MTREEKRTVLGVFDSLMHKTYSELNSFLGSETIEKMQKLYTKLKYEGYCERHGIRYEDMTEADFENAYMEGEE